MRIVRIAAVVALAVTAGPAGARSAVPLREFRDQSIVPASGKPLTLEQVRQATVRAAASTGWSLAPVSENVLDATRIVRGKHTVVVTIQLAPDRYSVTYKSSVNMKYDAHDGLAVIHPNYNVWAQELVDAIRTQVSAL